MNQDNHDESPARDGSTSESSAPTPARYTEAILELKNILDNIENEDVDLDELSDKVERAAVLIRFCRDRIQRTEMNIRQILEELSTDPVP